MLEVNSHDLEGDNIFFQVRFFLGLFKVLRVCSGSELPPKSALLFNHYSVYVLIPVTDFNRR